MLYGTELDRLIVHSMALDRRFRNRSPTPGHACRSRADHLVS